MEEEEKKTETESWFNHIRYGPSQTIRTYYDAPPLFDNYRL
jgi:hypothetical protein